MVGGTAPVQNADETRSGCGVPVAGVLIELGGGTQQAAIVSRDAQGGKVRRLSAGGGGPEPDLIQVGHQRAAAGCQFEKALAHPGHCGNVDLPGGGHDHVVLFVADLDGQWIAHGPASQLA
jgi:hypothetical protein